VVLLPTRGVATAHQLQTPSSRRPIAQQACEMAAPGEGHVLYQGVHKDSAGYKLLKSMGWQEGEGLVRLGSACCAAAATALRPAAARAVSAPRPSQAAPLAARSLATGLLPTCRRASPFAA
jgi:hypothetical protein